MILFVDESGHDHPESTYEVLGGIAIPQSKVWPFVCSLRDLVNYHFGDVQVWSKDETKGVKLLKRKRLAQAFGPEIPSEQRRQLVREFLELSKKQAKPRRYHFEAYAQSCRFFCRDILSICQSHSGLVLAAIIHPKAAPQIDRTLRADYAGLFYQLYQHSPGNADSRSLVIHDERDDSQCRELAQQLYNYYISEGKAIAQRVMPELMFVKSHLTLGILAADVICYILAQGFRHAQVLTQSYRPDLSEFVPIINEINRIPDDQPETLDDYGIIYLEDLHDLSRWSKIETTNQG